MLGKISVKDESEDGGVVEVKLPLLSVTGICNGATKCRNCEVFIITDLRFATDSKDGDEAAPVVAVEDDDCSAPTLLDLLSSIPEVKNACL